MNSVLKKESSVLEEFEIPEHLGGVVEDLKKEQQTLKKEIEAAKSTPVVRQQDESTKVFNLRQHQMELKLAALEEKKKKTEKELQDILQQKNSTLHADLKKLAQYILQETKKIDAKISSVDGLKNELQQIFEGNLADRKKSMQLIEEQNIYIHQLGDQLRETSKLLQSDFHFLTKELEKIQVESQNEARKLSALRQEVAHHQGLSDEIASRKSQLRELEQKISHGEKNALAFARLDDELSTLKADVQRLQEEKERLEAKTIRLHQEEFHGQEELSRLKLREKHLEHVISGKKDQILSLESDIQDVRKRLEMRKNDEHEVHTKFLHHRDQLVQLQTEIARLEGARASYEQMLSDSSSLYEEKKELFRRELEALKSLHEAKAAELTSAFEARKLQWEEEFRLFTEARKAELKTELEAIDRADLEDIRRKKSELLAEVSRIMGTLLTAEGFASSEEKTRTARKEIEKSFELVFGKTRRWKFW